MSFPPSGTDSHRQGKVSVEQRPLLRRHGTAQHGWRTWVALDPWIPGIWCQEIGKQIKCMARAYGAKVDPSIRQDSTDCSHFMSFPYSDWHLSHKEVKSLCAGPDSPRSDQKESKRYCPFSYFCNILILYHWDLRMAHRGQIRGNLPKQPEARWTS